MASFSPDHPESLPETRPPEQSSAEPRLLTRRDPEDGTDGSGKSQPTAAWSGLTGRFRRRPVHHLHSLETLRDRIAADGHPSRETLSLKRPGARRRLSHRSLRLFVAIPAVLVTLGCLALLVFALFLRHAMTAALPQLEGDLHVAGLSAPVTVSRDQLGVPTLQAGTLPDLLFAQGFVTAQDRLWQMDALRRHAAGELAEILGPSMVEHDRQQRILQLRAAADRAVLTLPPDQLAQLQAYARGVNAFLESNGDKLPVEFHLLHYQPAAWTPRDSLLVALAMFQDLGTSFPGKLRREALAQHLPPELLADLYPSRSWRDQPPTQPPPDLTAPKPEILQIPLDDSQVRLHLPSDLPAPDPGVRITGDQPQVCPECRAGSNNWVVSGQHSASGKPLLSNDMHLSLGVPDIWYQASLHVSASPTEPAFDVTGFSLPGVPFVIVGRNAHIAWSFTNLGADVQDLHLEHLRGSGDGTEFQQPDGSWSPVAHHRELIRVRGGQDRTLDVLTTSAHVGAATMETPLISDLYPGEHRAISLLWTPYDPKNLASPFYAVNAAASGSALVASLASFGGPSLNLVYADDAGHIGYHAIGRIPIRGPADRHTRVTPIEQLTPQNSNPLPDESPEGEPSGEPNEGQDKPQAYLASPSGRFLAVAYIRPRRVRPARPAPPAKSVDARQPRRPRRVPVEPTPARQTPDEPIAPVPPPLDYTIGSPIPSVPVDALEPAAQWSGYIPYEDLPAILDPADGVLATANARVTADDFPYALSDSWAPPYRVERIRKLLAGRTGLTPADMLAIETDTTSAFDRLLGERLTYAIDHTSDKALGREAKRLRQAADLLRTWAGGAPGNMTPDSSAAAIVFAARAQLMPMLLIPRIAQHDHVSATSSALLKIAALYDWPEQTVFLETLLTFQPARWLPPGYGNWNAFLAVALAHGLSDSAAPHDLSKWTYGSLHRVDIEHPVFSQSPLLSRLLGARTGTGAQPIGGDATTVQATSRSFGPSERFTADLADPAAGTGNITTGESGNPKSPHFLDQFPAWLHGTTFAMPLNGAPAQHTLRLLP